jgi:hypothetical protein
MQRPSHAASHLIPALLVLGLVACASDPAKRQEVAQTEATRMRAPEIALDSFDHFELAPIGTSPDVASDPRKVAVAQDLATRLEARLRPLLDQWNASAPAGAAKRTLMIQPTVASMHVVSTAARFWLGAMSGDSYIDLDLTLVDAQTKALVANQRIHRNANAMAGAWSFGASDRNLADYIVDIAYEYLASHHAK